MQVTIVKKKTGKEMTIEELAKCKLSIGLFASQRKYMLVTLADDMGFTFAESALAHKGQCSTWATGRALDKLLGRIADEGRTFHIFDTAKELYSWMAEE